MHVIWHQTVLKQFDSVFVAVLSKESQIPAFVVGAEEGVPAPGAALGDMVERSGDHKSLNSSHDASFRVMSHIVRFYFGMGCLSSRRWGGAGRVTG
jgi:hypothetical protein